MASGKNKLMNKARLQIAIADSDNDGVKEGDNQKEEEDDDQEKSDNKEEKEESEQTE